MLLLLISEDQTSATVPTTVSPDYLPCWGNNIVQVWRRIFVSQCALSLLPGVWLSSWLVCARNLHQHTFLSVPSIDILLLTLNGFHFICTTKHLLVTITHYCYMYDLSPYQIDTQSFWERLYWLYPRSLGVNENSDTSNIQEYAGCLEKIVSAIFCVTLY